MSVNVPRFSRGGQKQMWTTHDGPRKWKAGREVRNGASYAEVVSGRNEDVKEQSFHYNRHTEQSKRKQQLGWNGQEFVISEDEMKWLLGSFVGKTISLDGAFSVHNDLDFAGWSSIRATPLSGNHVLLSGEKQESIMEFLNQEASSLAKWF